MYHEEKAQRVINFIEKLTTHTKGELARQPFILEDFQRDIIRDIFGNIDENGNRIIREAFLFWPRKNGKTNFLASLGLYMLLADGEPGGEIIVAAADRAQAGMIHEIQKQMVLQSPLLSKKLKVYRNSIVAPDGSFIQARSADADTAHGYNANCVLMDELHSQPNRDLYNVLKTSMGARRSPLFLSISTAGFDKQSICYEVYDYAKKVKDGVIDDPTFYSSIFEAEIEDDIYSVDTWKKANPGYGITIKPEYLASQAEKAKALVSYENTFRRLHLNQWTSSEEKWISDEDWMSCLGDFTPEELEDLECYAGLDLASVEDLTAFVLLFTSGDKFRVIPFFFCCEYQIEKRKNRTGANYDAFVKRGELFVTEGNTTDYNFIRDFIFQTAERYNIKKIAFDRWNSSALISDLVEAGLPCEPYGQGYASQSPAIKQLEVLIRSKELEHNGNTVLRWMISNIQLTRDPADNVKINKAKSSDKVNGAVALSMAVGTWLTHKGDEDTGSSIYDNREIIFL